MGAFNTKAVLDGNPSLIPAISDRICQTFAAEGYEIKQQSLLNGGTDISVTKGGIFKAVLGMKTALKVTLIPMGDKISFEAGIGIFGQQAIPTIIMLFIAWPVLLTQIWGLVQQASLDDKALAVAQAVVNESRAYGVHSNSVTPPSVNIAIEKGAKFCINCGASLADNARFCSNCGSKIG